MTVHYIAWSLSCIWRCSFLKRYSQFPDRREEDPHACQHFAHGCDDQCLLQTNALTKCSSQQSADGGNPVHDNGHAGMHSPLQLIRCDGLAQADLVDGEDWPCKPKEELGQAYQGKGE